MDVSYEYLLREETPLWRDCGMLDATHRTRADADPADAAPEARCLMQVILYRQFAEQLAPRIMDTVTLVHDGVRPALNMADFALVV